MPLVATPSLVDTALAYAAAGRAVFPVAPGTKWPSLPHAGGGAFDLPWKRTYGHTPPDEATVRRWFTPAHRCGISIATGHTSGLMVGGTTYVLEILDVDDVETWDAFCEACAFSGLSALLARLVMERTPRGSGHLGYLCETVEGNTVLARRLDETTGKPLALIETRGEGGQAVVAPTPPGIHPLHPERGYVLEHGDWTDPPCITSEERTALFDVARSFNTYVEPARVVTGPVSPGTLGTGTRPGDKLNALADSVWWSDLLTAHGWTAVRAHGAVTYWRRPEKADDGCSATYGACGPYFYVFSSNADPFLPETAYSPFAALALLQHGGDFAACAKALAPQYTGVYVTDDWSGADAPDVPDMTATPDDIPPGWQASEPPPAKPRKKAITIPGIQMGRGKEAGPLANFGNIDLFLTHHPAWQDVFWWDAVRGVPMIGREALTEDHLVDIARWFSIEVEMSITALRMLEKCVHKQCRADQRDLLQHWLAALPPWDETPRLETWLSLVTGCAADAYGRLVSRVLPLSMVARAMDPGCICRDMVILEGPEGSGKSELVRLLGGGEAWTTVLSMGLESKEAHMMLLGVWLAEMSELDSLNRTGENRLKGFLTMRADTWIPKYSNTKMVVPRRTVFVGTTNEGCYLKGQTGNTRYLPIRTAGSFDLAYAAAIREQLFAEALRTYQAAPDAWWHQDDATQNEVRVQREARREAVVFEDDLDDWLRVRRFNVYERHPTGEIPEPGRTTWVEIARGYLQLDTPEKWGNVLLQKQVASALRVLGWEQCVIWDTATQKTRRVWVANM